MNKKLLLKVLLGTLFLNNCLYVGYSADISDEGLSGQQFLFGATPKDIGSYGVTLENKGDNWEDVSDDFNILEPDYKKINTYISDVNNNTYYLSKLLEGVPGSAAGGLIKHVSDVDEEVDKYDERITAAKTIANNAKQDAEAAQGQAADAATAAGNAASDANDAKEEAKTAAQQVADKVDASDVESIITTEVSSGGTIYSAIGKSAAEGGSIAQAIEDQVTAGTGPISDAISTESKNTIDLALQEGGSINKELVTKANITDLEEYTKTTALNDKLADKADKSPFDVLQDKVNDPNTGLDTKIDSNGAGQAIGNALDVAIDNGGSIFNAVTTEAGQIAQEIKSQVASETGIISSAISSGASIAIDNALQDNGSIKQAIDASANSSVPVGTIVMWGSVNIPDGWLELDGRSTEGYPKLEALYGTNVPDFRGQFVRGYDPTGSVDPDGDTREILSKQDDMLKKHNHGPGSLSGYYKGRDVDDKGTNAWGAEMFHYSEYDSNISTSQAVQINNGRTDNTGGKETRPKNIAVKFIIKAK